MTRKRPKRPRDANILAKRIVDIATGEVEDREPTPEEQGKDAAAVALSRKGDLSRRQGASDEAHTFSTSGRGAKSGKGPVAMGVRRY